MAEESTSQVVHLKGNRRPRAETRILLFTHAGGRCEFDNCNRYLLKHHVTHKPGNFAEMAHIVAFRPRGPRGQSTLSGEERNDLTNLMLLCAPCHKLIDDHPDLYQVSTLRAFKADHEARILMLTEAKPDKETSPLVLRAAIGDSPVSITNGEIQEAVAPYYFDPREVFEINLGDTVESRTEAYWQAGKETIRGRVTRYYERLRQEGGQAQVSVFALAPIPFLVYLGSRLSNKSSTALFQRHRDTDDWVWKEDDVVVEFETRVVAAGTDSSKVALLVCASGRIPREDYSGAIDQQFTVYEIAPVDVEPSFELMRTRASLEAFRASYRATLQRVVAEHPEAQAIHVLPAAPAPAAVALGLDWMSKTHPSLVVHDKFGEEGFVKTMEIAAHGRSSAEHADGKSST